MCVSKNAECQKVDVFRRIRVESLAAEGDNHSEYGSSASLSQCVLLFLFLPLIFFLSRLLVERKAKPMDARRTLFPSKQCHGTRAFNAKAKRNARTFGARA
jgi:hypothetical protein